MSNHIINKFKHKYMSKEELQTISETSRALVTTKEVEACMLPIRGQQVLIDRDVAALYGVETKRINEAVRNNPDKFPEGYIFELTEAETEDVKAAATKKDDFADEKFDRKKISNKTRYAPKAFTERGLYMLATILKSARATQTTIAIIDTFAKVKELSRHLDAMQTPSNNPQENAAHAQRTGQLLSEILTSELRKDEKSNVGIELNMMTVNITTKKK